MRLNVAPPWLDARALRWSACRHRPPPRSLRSSAAAPSPMPQAAGSSRPTLRRPIDVVAKALLGDARHVRGRLPRRARGAAGPGREVPAPVRGRAIQQIGRLVEDNKEALARLVTREIGKPYAESLGEVQEIVDTCNFFLGEGRRLYGQTVPSEMPDKQLFTFRVPVGVAAIITAGNFPVAVPSWYLVPALLCGNAVVWKPAEYAPPRGRGARPAVPSRRPARRRAEPRARATGRPRSTGSSGRSRRGWSTRSGSPARRTSAGGSASSAAATCSRPCLELGGKNPMVVMQDADLDLAVEGALFSGFGTAGQRCTSLGTVIVHESVHDEFLARFDAAVEAAAIGDPDAGRALRADDRRAVPRPLRGLARAGSRDHHTVLGSTGTGRITRRQPAHGLRRRPGRRPLLPPDDRRRRARATTSSPTRRRSARSSASRRSRTFDEAMELANGHGYGLSSSIYTTDPKHAFRFRERISAGMVSVNNSTSRRRGAPALRRQRQVGQRLAPVGRLGARPVHPLAVDELGLRGQAAEGADGRGRRGGRPVVRGLRLEARRPLSVVSARGTSAVTSSAAAPWPRRRPRCSAAPS